MFALSTSSVKAGCANCRAQEEGRLLDSDTIPLTTPLISFWRTGEHLGGHSLRSLYPPDVVPFLKANLTWRVLDVRQ